MLILKDRDLQRLREEYITATIENMSQQQIVAYLRQILHNEISHSTGEELAKKIVKRFGESFYEGLSEEIFYGEGEYIKSHK